MVMARVRAKGPEKETIKFPLRCGEKYLHYRQVVGDSRRHFLAEILVGIPVWTLVDSIFSLDYS